MTSPAATVAATLLTTAALVLPAAAASGAPPAESVAVPAECRAQAPTVAKAKLVTPRGAYLGRARLTYETVDGISTLCAVVDVARPHRKASTLVTRDLAYEGPLTGGRQMTIERATKLKKSAVAADFELTDTVFVLKAKIDGNGVAKAKVRFTAP